MSYDHRDPLFTDVAYGANVRTYIVHELARVATPALEQGEGYNRQARPQCSSGVHIAYIPDI